MARTYAKIILYTRVSSADQKDGSGLIRQGGDLRRWLSKEGYDGTPITAVTDEGRSAFHGHHISKGELGRLAGEAEAGEHANTLLVVENLDRWSREGPEETLDLIRRFTRNGVTVRTLDGDWFNAGEPIELIQIITSAVKADLARKESQKKADRTAANWRIKRERAQQSGGAVTKLMPAWLEKKGQSIAVVADRAALVLRWFHMADSGIGAVGIAKAMNKEGIEPWAFFGRKAKGWNRTFITRTLSNRAVLGEFQPHEIQEGKRVPKGEPWLGYFPAIVPADLFNRVNLAASERKAVAVAAGGQGRAKMANLFAGLTKCEECGSALVRRLGRKAGTTYTTKAGTTGHRKHDEASLCCPLANTKGKCSNNRNVGYRRFEQAMLDSVLHLALDDTAFSNKTEVVRLNQTIAERKREIDVASAKADRLWSAWADDGSDVAKKLAKAAEEEKKALEANVAALEEQRVKASGRATSEEHLLRVADVRALLDHPDEAVRIPNRLKVAQAFRTVIDGIWLDTDGVATVMVAGGAINFRIHKGKVVQTADVMQMQNPRTARTLTHGGEGKATLALVSVDRRFRKAG